MKQAFLLPEWSYNSFSWSSKEKYNFLFTETKFHYAAFIWDALFLLTSKFLCFSFVVWNSILETKIFKINR